MRSSRPVSWIRAARKAFDAFPDQVRATVEFALAIAAEGRKPDNAKPLHGLGSGVMEIVAGERSGTYRVVFAVQIGEDIWVLHAFQKKSTSGIKTPVHEIDVVRERLKRLKDSLR